MSKVYTPSDSTSNQAHVSSIDSYQKRYQDSISDPESFWAEIAQRLDWMEPWTSVRKFDFVNGQIEWFSGGKLNASYNCIDRHIKKGHGDETAIIWEGNDPNQSRKFTYNDLLKEVSQFANALKSLGVEKGDRVCIYMQMVPELAFAVLACARIGAVHSVVFGAFSSDSLRDRINDSSCKILITQDTGVRGTKQNIPMKVNADNAVAETPSIEHVIVVRRTGEPVNMDSERDLWWHEAISGVDAKCEPEEMDAEDPLFILYTSG
ncbi:MAG: AMP-binding protein, partial [Candidatus Marinimicrobia bacterium]|nr:AMP-binding protein [Candidatus Neomarinimicrobiota bacterium]